MEKMPEKMPSPLVAATTLLKFRRATIEGQHVYAGADERSPGRRAVQGLGASTSVGSVRASHKLSTANPMNLHVADAVTSTLLDRGLSADTHSSGSHHSRTINSPSIGNRCDTSNIPSIYLTSAPCSIPHDDISTIACSIADTPGTILRNGQNKNTFDPLSMTCSPATRKNIFATRRLASRDLDPSITSQLPLKERKAAVDVVSMQYSEGQDQRTEEAAIFNLSHPITSVSPSNFLQSAPRSPIYPPVSSTEQTILPPLLRYPPTATPPQTAQYNRPRSVSYVAPLNGSSRFPNRSHSYHTASSEPEQTTVSQSAGNSDRSKNITHHKLNHSTYTVDDDQLLLQMGTSRMGGRSNAGQNLARVKLHINPSASHTNDPSGVDDVQIISPATPTRIGRSLSLSKDRSHRAPLDQNSVCETKNVKPKLPLEVRSGSNTDDLDLCDKNSTTPYLKLFLPADIKTQMISLHPSLKASMDGETAATVSHLLTKPHRGSVQFQEKFHRRFSNIQVVSQAPIASSIIPTIPELKIELEEPKNEMIPIGTSIGSRRLWRVASASIKLGMRLARVYKYITRKTQNVQLAPLVETSSLTYMLRNMQAHTDTSFSIKVRELLNAFQKTRTPENLEALERTLSIRLRSFSRFSINQRNQFIEIMNLEAFQKDTLLVKEGHISLAFYFILNGQVEIFKIKDGLKYRINVLNSGDSLGDRTMNMLSDRRTACVATTMDTELLRIDKADFFKIAQVKDERSISNRIAQLSRIPYMEASENGFIEKAAHFFKCITYDANEQILLEGTENLDLFWILRGTCRCVKLVPFVQKRVRNGFSSVRNCMRAHQENIPLAEDEERSDQLLRVQELQEYDFFPDMPKNIERLDQWLTDSMFNKDDYIDFLTEQDPICSPLLSYASVIAKTKVEVMTISRVDFCRLASVRMIIKLLLTQNIQRVPIEMLQTAYLEKRSWDCYKKRIASEVRNRQHNK
ncbi:hypothetical protein BASA61_010210 [Batrachochytrium salamandrivorans]|nr:hypothetical protein BASA61_010210 [Batrachochytrium salamandrivorans]KAH9274438.1 hypothetical protein BASA83_003069 [Batrachochytrium salamandrivorans]